MKNDYSDINDEKFLNNKKKRKNPVKKTSSPAKTAQQKRTTSKSSSKKSEPKKKDRATAAIVLSVLCAIAASLCCLIIFVPGFKTLALRHILSSISASGSFKNVHETENSISDGIHGTVISTDGEKGSLHRDVYTFLATGTDHSGNLTDVIMIAKFDVSDSSVNILQIPRDTYVKLNSNLVIDDNGNISKNNFSSGYETKINSVFSTGKSLSKTPINNLLNEAKGQGVSKIQALCKSSKYSYLGVTQQQVSRYLSEKDSSKKKELFTNMQKNFGIKYLSTLIYYSYGIPIDYHAQVNTKGFRNIVDAIGGVDLYVPQNMYHNDPTQDLYINLKKGQQHLDGDKAEQFVRFRGYTLGDIDRIDAQKSFINAFLNKLFSPSTITRISQITNEIQKNLYTNLTLQDTANFASKALDMDLTSGFSMITLPGYPVDVTRGGAWVSYYSADKDKVIELVNNSFNKYDINLPEEMFGLIELTPSSVSTSVDKEPVSVDGDNASPDTEDVIQNSDEDLEADEQENDANSTDASDSVTASQDGETDENDDETENEDKEEDDDDVVDNKPSAEDGTDSSDENSDNSFEEEIGNDVVPEQDLMDDTSSSQSDEQSTEDVNEQSQPVREVNDPIQALLELAA